MDLEEANVGACFQDGVVMFGFEADTDAGQNVIRGTKLP
jgi:hypothetical protein